MLLNYLKTIIDQHMVESRDCFHLSVLTRLLGQTASISGQILKSCSRELAKAWCPIYQKSIDTHSSLNLEEFHYYPCHKKG